MNDHIYNKDVNITSDPYLCSYNDECLNKDFSLDDYIDFSVSVSDSINNFEVCHTCDFCSFFDTWLTTNNSLFFDTDTSFSGDSVSKNLGEFSNNNVEENIQKKFTKLQYNKQRLEKRREKEKERRYNLKQLFDKLEKCLQCKKQLSKNEILQKSQTYINFLESESQRLILTKKELKKENFMLLKKLKLMKKIME